MHDVILLIAVIAYMAAGYFVVGKVGNFIEKNYKSYDIDSDNENDNDKE